MLVLIPTHIVVFIWCQGNFLCIENHDQSKCSVVEPVSNGYIYSTTPELMARVLTVAEGKERARICAFYERQKLYPQSLTNTSAEAGAEQGQP